MAERAGVSMKSMIGAALPSSIKQPLRELRAEVKNYFATRSYHGTGRFCPVCEKSSRRFEHYGVVPRPDALCMRCHALERHRLLWLFMKQRTDLFDGRRKAVLHVAPEPCLESRFRRQLGRDYLTADLCNAAAMVKMDITDIRYPDESFDVIYCSHVLEHVTEDRRAMREFHRVLKPQGWAILLVPIVGETTFEDASIVDPAERERVFGQFDHVRNYGLDYPERLSDAGFHVEVTRIEDLASQSDAERMGLTPVAGEIYFCTR